MDEGSQLLEKLPANAVMDGVLIRSTEDAAKIGKEFIDAIAQHRHWGRELKK